MTCCVSDQFGGENESQLFPKITKFADEKLEFSLFYISNLNLFLIFFTQPQLI